MDMWTGLAAALILAFLTAISPMRSFPDIYPEAGAGSSYYFAEARRSWAKQLTQSISRG